MSAPPKPEEKCTLRVSAFDLPHSSFLDAETRAVLERQAQEGEALGVLCPQVPHLMANDEALIAFRNCFDQHYHPQMTARHQVLYKAGIEPKTIDGVYTEIFTPQAGIAEANRQRVLINLHGGGFLMGARWVGRMESLPIAAIGKIKVVSVDYRMGPEHRFPAASDDVAKVYRALLKDYRPESIGIYGCSAGGVLTAQTVAWLQKERLPRPGAVGMFGGAASYWGEGDSGRFYAARGGMPLPEGDPERFYAARAGMSLSEVADPRENPYFKETDPNDSLAFPLRSAERMAQFPPSLLIATTRDLALSSVVHTHTRLVELGVKADLHVWEGLDHAFHYVPELPQSRRLYEIVVKFFAEHLKP